MKKHNLLLVIGIILAIVLLLIIGNINYNIRATGKVVQEVDLNISNVRVGDINIAEQIAEGEIENLVNITEKVNVEVKDPGILSTTNNKIIEFNMPEGKLTLEFDLLNYSEWVQTDSENDVEAENFDIDMNDSSNRYKWGYNVKLKDLNFMSKIKYIKKNPKHLEAKV